MSNNRESTKIEEKNSLKLQNLRLITPYNPSNITTVEDALMAMQGMSFQARNLGNALEVLTTMTTTPDTFRVLTLAGAMIPAGLDELISQLIEKKIIHAIISTGANITHALVNALSSSSGQAHFQGFENADDQQLFENGINRIYDTYLPESAYITTEDKMLEILKEFENELDGKVVLPSKLFSILGSKLKHRCFVGVAHKEKVPIFCGATSDSEIGLNLELFREREEINIILDELGDITKFKNLLEPHAHSGIIIIGGGVPRNWGQQIHPYIEQFHLNKEDKIALSSGEGNRKIHGYDFSIRLHTAIPQDGGLSGCTIQESISWGKYKPDAKHQSVWGDATILFPLLVSALYQRLERTGQKVSQI